MLFFILVVITTAAIVVAIKSTNNYGETEFWAGIIGTIFGVLAVISLGLIVMAHLVAPSESAKIAAEREILVYQAENALYENDNDIGKKELADQIAEWNSIIVANKAVEKNFWIGIYVPNIYGQFEEIPATILGGEGSA